MIKHAHNKSSGGFIHIMDPQVSLIIIIEREKKLETIRPKIKEGEIDFAKIRSLILFLKYQKENVKQNGTPSTRKLVQIALLMTK